MGGALGLNTGDLTGVNTAARQTIIGDIVNSGTIEVSASRQPVAIGIDVAATGLFAGNVRNSGSITATGLGAGAPGQVMPVTLTQAELNQAIADNGGVVNPVIANLLAGVRKAARSASRSGRQASTKARPALQGRGRELRRDHGDRRWRELELQRE